MVAVRSRVFASDEELAKRNDDYKVRDNMTLWKVRNRPIWTAKRVVALAIAVLCIWLFVHNIPTDLGPRDPSRRPRYVRNPPAPQRPQRAPIQKPDFRYAQEKARDTPPEPVPPVRQPQYQQHEEPPQGFNYDGPVKFFALASSLHSIASVVDYRQGNRHVLFAASDLNSLSALMPIACEMANWKRNHVHMAVMGRDEMPLEDIQQVNGANFQDCPVFFHDARPDQASISTDGRMQLSVSGALGHINTYMLPRAVITTDAEHENVFFTVGVSRTAKALGLTHISVPKDAPQKLGWMARLDASSLNSWFSATFDVLIQAPLDSAGSLIRLLTSLEKADYTGFFPPRLILELPHDIGLPTQNFLTRFKWPPFGTNGWNQGDQLLIKRRISEQHVPVEEASRRFVESYYPSSPRGPHVLILSPQAELSPAYFHYLKLHLLEYRHSYDRPNPARDMLGISLETPSTHLNSSAEFEIPRMWERSEHDEDEEPPVFEPFCWQAPNSNAALYFGDKWIELHSFLTKRRTASLHPSTQEHHAKRPQRVSHHSPSWMEHMLDLMRLRGYYLHYPGVFQRMVSSSSKSASAFSTAEESLVIIHNELYHPPEEFAYPVAARAEKTTATALPVVSEAILEVDADYLSSHHPAEGTSNTLHDERPLVHSLDPILPPLSLIITKDPLNPTEPANHPLPAIINMALLDYAGEELLPEELEETSTLLRRGYRHFAGGCTEEQAKVETRELGSAADLFCLEDQDVDNSMLLPRPESLVGSGRRRGGAPPAADSAPTRIHGSEGAAANINRVKEAAKYEETAKAGFAKKLADKSKSYQKWTPLDTANLRLTDDEDVSSTDQIESNAAAAAKAPAGGAKPPQAGSKPPQAGTKPLQAGAKPAAAAAAAAHAADAPAAGAPNAAFGARPAPPPPKGANRFLHDHDDADDDSVPRDAPPLTHDIRPGSNFEEQMAQRDAAKKGSLNERARGGAVKGRIPVIEPGKAGAVEVQEEEVEVVGDDETVLMPPSPPPPHPPPRRRPAVPKRPAAPGAQPAVGKIPVRVIDAEDDDDADVAEPPADPMHVLLDDDAQVRSTKGDMHPADVIEEERRFGAGGRNAGMAKGHTWTDEDGVEWEMGDTTGGAEEVEEVEEMEEEDDVARAAVR